MPIIGVPSKDLALAQEPEGEGATQSEPDGVPPQQRLEQAYQLLVAEGKKPSGRALAERAHVHRSTCVEWLRTRQEIRQSEPLVEEPGRDDASRPAEPLDATVMEMPEIKMDQPVAADDVSPGVSPDFSLPEDTPDM
jgi:hypothetical protein